uniref:Uncharacterized protein n=1 Tax=Anguilla anguilla TaxID=7936 RepID=A0A0E9SC46_ANGAN
MIQIKQEAW